jgi:hypothetical protein
VPRLHGYTEPCQAEARAVVGGLAGVNAVSEHYSRLRRGGEFQVVDNAVHWGGVAGRDCRWRAALSPPQACHGEGRSRRRRLDVHHHKACPVRGASNVRGWRGRRHTKRPGAMAVFDTVARQPRRTRSQSVLGADGCRVAQGPLEHRRRDDDHHDHPRASEVPVPSPFPGVHRPGVRRGGSGTCRGVRVRI